jgi:hypothetical protein
MPEGIFLFMCRGDIYLMPAEDSTIGSVNVHWSTILLWSDETDSGKIGKFQIKMVRVRILGKVIGKSF